MFFFQAQIGICERNVKEVMFLHFLVEYISRYMGFSFLFLVMLVLITWLRVEQPGAPTFPIYVRIIWGNVFPLENMRSF